MNKAQKACVDKWFQQSLIKDKLIDLSYVSQETRYTILEEFVQEFKAIDPAQDTVWQVRLFGGGNPSLGKVDKEYDSKEKAQQDIIDFIHDVTSGDSDFTIETYDAVSGQVTYKSNQFVFTRVLVEAQ